MYILCTAECTLILVLVQTSSRTSDQDSLPLISTMVVNPVNMNLNGTVVNCEDLGTSESMTASTTIIIELSMFCIIGCDLVSYNHNTLNTQSWVILAEAFIS